MNNIYAICGLALFFLSQTLFAEGSGHMYKNYLKPEIFKVENIDIKTEELLKSGYIAVSKEKFKQYSYYTAMSDIRKKARLHGAQVVIFSDAKIEGEIEYNYRITQPEVTRILSGDKNKNDLNNVPVGIVQKTPSRMGGSDDEYTVLYFYKYNSITGIYPVDLSDKDRIYNGIQGGVVTKFVKQGSAADDVIQINDIILKINDE